MLPEEGFVVVDDGVVLAPEEEEEGVELLVGVMLEVGVSVVGTGVSTARRRIITSDFEVKVRERKEEEQGWKWKSKRREGREAKEGKRRENFFLPLSCSLPSAFSSLLLRCLNLSSPPFPSLQICFLPSSLSLPLLSPALLLFSSPAHTATPDVQSSC